MLRADSDNLFSGTETSRTREAEVSASGPVVTDKLFYAVSANGFLTDTRWWQDFDEFFEGPYDKSASGLAKLDFQFTPTMRLGTQFLYSMRDLRPYEFNWTFNLPGLPGEDRTSNRIAAIFSQTVSGDFFYTASLSRFWHDASIGTGAKEDVPVNVPFQYDFFLQYVTSGSRAWWSETRQVISTVKTDFVYQPARPA